MHGVFTLASDELLKFFLVTGRRQCLSLGHSKGFSYNFFVVAAASLIVLNLLYGANRGCMIELHILSCVVNIDSSWLNWHQVGTQDHLAEVVVVHVLHAGFLLGTVDVDTFVLLIDLIEDFTTD